MRLSKREEARPGVPGLTGCILRRSTLWTITRWYVKEFLSYFRTELHNSLQGNTECLSSLSITEWQMWALYKKPLLVSISTKRGNSFQFSGFVISLQYPWASGEWIKAGFSWEKVQIFFGGVRQLCWTQPCNDWQRALLKPLITTHWQWWTENVDWLTKVTAWWLACLLKTSKHLYGAYMALGMRVSKCKYFHAILLQTNHVFTRSP